MTSTPTCLFYHLPYDCWLNIINRLHSNDILALSKTSRALHTSTNHLLYRDIKWLWKTWRGFLKRLLLLQTILARPHLASLVRNITFLTRDQQPYLNWTKPDIPWRAQADRYKDMVAGSVDIIERAGFPDNEASDWICALQGGETEAFIAVLISQLPGLTSLRLEWEFAGRRGYPDRMLKNALSSDMGLLSKFSCLRLVEYGGNVRQHIGYHAEPIYEPSLVSDSYRGPHNKELYIGWFFLPFIRHLEIRLPDITLLKQKHPEELNLRHFRTLILVGATISEHDVLFLLTQTSSSLQNLHLGLTFKRHNRPTLKNREVLAQALASVRNSVENFCMKIEYYSCCDMCEQVRRNKRRKEVSWEPVREVFKTFTKLRTLEIQMAVLFGPDPDQADTQVALPRTLTKLCLRDDLREPHRLKKWTHIRTTDCTHAFLNTDWRSSTPLLGYICLRLWYLDEDNEYEGYESDICEHQDNSWERLRSVCKREGIELENLDQGYPVSTGSWIPDTSWHSMAPLAHPQLFSD